jgi:hypothetical protein
MKGFGTVDAHDWPAVAESAPLDVHPVAPVVLAALRAHAQLEMTERAEPDFVEGLDR